MAGPFYTCISDCKFHKLQWLSYDTKCVDLYKISKDLYVSLIRTWRLEKWIWWTWCHIQTYLNNDYWRAKWLWVWVCVCDFEFVTLMTYILMNLNTTHQLNEFSIMILMSWVQVDDLWSVILITWVWPTFNELNDSGLRLRIIEFNYLWLAINELNNLSLWLGSLSLMAWVTKWLMTLIA